MRKCKGCGAVLQNEDPKKIGYVLREEQEYCQRCFRLTHYGDLANFKLNSVSNKQVFEIYRENKKELFCLITDVCDALILDQDPLLDDFKDYQLILVVNKIDTLPKNVNDRRFFKDFTQYLGKVKKKYPNIQEILLTQIHDPDFKEVLFETMDMLKKKTVVFAGRTNVGKSSLINNLLENATLTTSVYPGTTISTNRIEIGEYTIIDTPGLSDEESLTNYIVDKRLEEILIKKTVKPKVFQIRDAQSYFIEGILRVDVEPKEEASAIFFVQDGEKIHRTKRMNADIYYEKNRKDFKLELKPMRSFETNVHHRCLFVIKGLGLLRINGMAKVTISLYEKMRVYYSEVMI